MIFLTRLHHQLFDQLHIARFSVSETNKIGHPGTCLVANVKPNDCLYWSPHGNP